MIRVILYTQKDFSEFCTSQFGCFPKYDLKKNKYPPLKGKKKYHTRCFKVKIKAAHFSPTYINITCVYILHFLSDILHLLAPFILDHVLNVSAGLAINSSSMNYVFLPR